MGDELGVAVSLFSIPRRPISSHEQRAVNAIDPDISAVPLPYAVARRRRTSTYRLEIEECGPARCASVRSSVVKAHEPVVNKSAATFEGLSIGAD